MMVVLKKGFKLSALNQGEYIQAKGEDLCNYKCPKCGNLAKISKQNHQVDYFGTLTPAVMCPHMCNFNDRIQLDEWVPEAKGSA
jgi:C4-type Zn-finger protein